MLRLILRLTQEFAGSDRQQGRKAGSFRRRSRSLRGYHYTGSLVMIGIIKRLISRRIESCTARQNV